ncbi:MAG: extracellular solute-binding protein [Clostridiales bacterium]|nr:extracellular solute-binding protein [Clostridiales bacterium]
MKNLKMFVMGLVFGGVLFGTAAMANPVTREIIFGVGVTYNGTTVEFDAGMEPFIMEGRTFLPVRTIAEMVGLDVNFVDGVVHLSAEGFTPTAARPERTVINIWSFADEVPNMAARYMELNPEFAERYEINTTIIATDGGGYEAALDRALTSGGSGAPDIYTAESYFVSRYAQGDMANYAMTYSDLGIENLSQRIADARISPYIVEMGSRGDDVVGLAFQGTGGAVIYRRSIALEVWGNDDPDFVAAQIGPGWDRFFAAAEELDAAGYNITSGLGDVWNAVRTNGGPWITDGNLSIHPNNLEMFDYARTLYQNGWTNDTDMWSDSWFSDMSDYTYAWSRSQRRESDSSWRPVFCFLGPAWLINYVMDFNSGDTYGDWAIAVPPVGFMWGGTWVIPNANMNPDVRDGVRELIEWITLDTSDTGLQYHWANGTLFGEGGTKDTVASAAVMERADGSLDFLVGQNMFDVFIPAGEIAVNTRFSSNSDWEIDYEFLWAVSEYANGNLTLEQALSRFKEEASAYFGNDMPR